MDAGTNGTRRQTASLVEDVCLAGGLFLGFVGVGFGRGAWNTFWDPSRVPCFCLTGLVEGAIAAVCLACSWRLFRAAGVRGLQARRALLKRLDR